MSPLQLNVERAGDSDQVLGKLLIDTLIGALSLGFIGSILGAFFLPGLNQLGPWLGAKFDLPGGWWPYGALGLAVGAVGGLTKSVAELRRRRGMRDAAAETGLSFASEGTGELESKLRGFLDHNQSLKLANVLFKDVGTAKFFVADLTIRNTSSESNASSHQTGAYFEAGDLPFPTFTMQPEGKMLKLFSSLVGDTDIDFEAFPEFSRQYHLTGVNPEAVRRLFTDALLTHFSGDAGWQIRASENRLLMFRHNRRCSPAELSAFINQALSTFGLFVDALQERGSSVAAAPMPNAQEQAARLSGPLGRMVRANLVTRQELDEFLAQPTPRQIPTKIKRQQTGRMLFLCLWGTMFGGIGGIVLAGMLAAGEWRWSLFAGLFPLIGFTVLFFALRSHRRGVRLLRDGRVADGKLESLEATNMWVNGQQRYRARVQLSAIGSDEPRTFSIYGAAARRAEHCLAKAEPVRVLYLPDHPERATLVDSLVTDCPVTC